MTALKNRRIRQAIPSDAAGLKNCMTAAYLGYQDRMKGVRLPPMDIDYLDEINNYPTWVMESEGFILGGLIMVWGEDSASIANIAVNPEYQGQGIGGELMSFALSMGKQKSCTEMQLTTHVLLTENIAFYRHLGWEETARDGSRVFMRKSI